MRKVIVMTCAAALCVPATASATVTTRGFADHDTSTRVKLGFRRILQRDPKVNQIRVSNALYSCNDGTTLRSGFRHIHGQLLLNRKLFYRGHFGRNRQDKISGRVTSIGRPGQGLITIGRVRSLVLGPNNTVCRTDFKFTAGG